MLVGQKSLQQNLESFYQYPISTAGSAVLSQEDVQDLSLVSSPTDFHIVDYSLYLGKRILILKPQLQAGINIVVDSAPPFFSTSTGFTSTFPISEDVGTATEFAFSSTEIAVSGGSGGAFPPYSYTPSVPGNWSNSFSLITPTNIDSALDILANNMNERYTSRYRIQNLNATSTLGFNGLNNSNILTAGVGSITLGGTGTVTLSSTAANTAVTSGTTMNITSGTGMSVNSGGNLNATIAGGGTVLAGTSTSINCTAGNMSISTNSTTGNNNLGSSANTSGTTNVTSGYNISMQIVDGSTSPTLMNGSMVRGKGIPSSTTTSNSFFGASDGVTLANASRVIFYSPTHLYYALPATNSAYTVDVIANLSDNANPLNFFTARISAVFGSAGVSYTIIDQTTTYTYQQGFVPPVSATLTAVANAISVSFTHAGYTCRPKASWEWMKVA